MKYMTVNEASLRWGIDTSRIGRLIREGRIEGAYMCRRKWLIPENATKPEDRRTSQMKTLPKEPPFRFPLFLNSEKHDFTPPLSSEEQMLQNAQKDFFACDFGKAKKSFMFLSEQAESIYVRISALFFMCALCTAYDVNINWVYYYRKLNLMLSADLPHKKDMEIFLPWLDCFQGRFETAREKLCTDNANDYHPTTWYMYVWMTILHFTTRIQDGIQLHFSDSYEILCHLMEHDGHYLESQELHLYLFIGYFAADEQQKMLYHLRCAIRIAEEHHLYYLPADLMSYYHDTINKVLSEYSVKTATLIRENSRLIFHNFIRFTEKDKDENFYSKLSSEDYPLTAYALSGYTNKQVADILKVSQRTIINRYNKIYNKLGVSGKAELIATLNSFLKK